CLVKLKNLSLASEVDNVVLGFLLGFI
ncbi:hypothetical protein Tco_0442751, partial [Tanacetum coccineum]